MTAIQWINSCKCRAGKDLPIEYPSRLLDLGEVKPKSDSVRFGDRRVKLVLTKDWGSNGPPDLRNKEYVTLSHRWGSPAQRWPKSRLNADTEKEFTSSGLKINELPKTFQEAMHFAARLPGVGFIWIDSLCIIQGEKLAAVQDWFAESAKMDRVYHEAYLNISATAAEDGNGGLYRKREHALLFENEIPLNIDGIPGGRHERVDRSSSDTSDVGNLDRVTILDASFWRDRVDQAPVNKRGEY
jgi:hypothetical protein